MQRMLTQHICMPLICRGKVVAGTEEKEAIVYGEVDLDCVADVRRSIPTSKQKRLDLYSLPHPKT